MFIMKVVGYILLFFISYSDVLKDIEFDKLVFLGWDVFVKISVIVVNFVDYKIC